MKTERGCLQASQVPFVREALFAEPLRRVFVALPISENVQEVVDRLQVEGQGAAATMDRIAWASPAQLHITLVFLGEIRKDFLPLEEAIREVAALSSPFSISISGLGVFPGLVNPRVIFARMVEEGPVTALHQQLVPRVTALGFQLEKRPYQPHLTVGRIRGRRLSGKLVRWLREKRNFSLGRCDIASVHFMESRRGPQGPLYASLFFAPLVFRGSINRS